MTEPCEVCGGTTRLEGRVSTRGLGYELLPGSRPLHSDIVGVICMDCGRLRLHVPIDRRAKLARSRHWILREGPTQADSDSPHPGRGGSVRVAPSSLRRRTRL